MHPLTWGVVLLALTVLGKPVQRKKRYDFDCNDTPDWCYVDGDSAYCLLSDGSWTTLPAISTTACPTSKASSSITKSSTTMTAAATTTKTTTYSSSSTKPTTSTASKSIVTAAAVTLPSPADFDRDKGIKWKIELQGNLGFTDPVGSKDVNADKGRTGKISDKIIWNFGDMQCGTDWQTCGFSVGPAFYGTDSVMIVNTSAVDLVQNYDFVQAWSGDSPPQSPQWAWGMDTSNVAEINSTHGVAFAWEAWRGASDGTMTDCGNAVASITLGADKPFARRVGPLLTGPDSIALGLLAILRDGDYIYTYSEGGPSNVIIGRVPADDSVFDASKYEFLQHGTANTWSPGIPPRGSNSFGATTVNPGGNFGCAAYGSVFYNSYLEKYIILCNIHMSSVNMYTSDTPSGPWSAEYRLTSSGSDGLLSGSYGSHAHPEYGNGKEWYFSIGPNSVFQVFKVTFDY